MKSGYVVKGCTVRGYWNTAKRIAVQIRYRSGTKVGQNRYKTGTDVRQKWDICRAGWEQIARRATEKGSLQNSEFKVR